MSLNPYEPPQTIDCARKPPARWNRRDAPWLVIYLLTIVAGAVVGVGLERVINPDRGSTSFFRLFVAYLMPLTCGLIGLAAGVAYRITHAIRAARAGSGSV